MPLWLPPIELVVIECALGHTSQRSIFTNIFPLQIRHIGFIYFVQSEFSVYLSKPCQFWLRIVYFHLRAYIFTVFLLYNGHVGIHVLHFISIWCRLKTARYLLFFFDSKLFYNPFQLSELHCCQLKETGLGIE